MLDWIKRIAGPVPREQSVESEPETVAATAKIERLATRLHHSELVAEEPPAAPPAEELATPPAEALTAPVEALTVPAEALAPPPAEIPATPPAKAAANPPTKAPASPVAKAPAKPMAKAPAKPITARVIAVVSQKGGSGKTTIAAHLAVRAAEAGDGPVMLIDTDPQHSLTEWFHARNDERLSLATLSLDDLPDALAEACGSGASIVIIDTPPALITSIEQVIAVADLVVVPARPSPHDLRAVGPTVGMTRNAKKPFMFVVNGAAPRANITAEAVAALSEHGRVAPVILYQRTEFAASMIDGRTVMESAPSGRSAQEIADLWKHVFAQISMRAAA